jgi:hypothetical protein
MVLSSYLPTLEPPLDWWIKILCPAEKEAFVAVKLVDPLDPEQLDLICV